MQYIISTGKYNFVGIDECTKTRVARKVYRRIERGYVDGNARASPIQCGFDMNWRFEGGMNKDE